MEFSFATIIPAFIFTVGIMLIIYFGIRLTHLIFRLIGWMVLNGYWFPKTMRKQRDDNVARIEANIVELNKIIDGRK